MDVDSDGNGPFLVTDEEREAVMALRVALEWTCRAMDGEDHLWKWSIIALHNALQGFMVLALAGGSGLGALTEQSRNEWLAAHEANEPPPKEWLMPVPDLFKAIQRPASMSMVVGSRHLEASKDQLDAVKELNQLRRRFEHFVPMVWIVITDGLLETFLRCVDVIEFAGFVGGTVLWSDTELREEARQLVADFRSLGGS